jgi:hypothetical protein
VGRPTTDSSATQEETKEEDFDRRLEEQRGNSAAAVNTSLSSCPLCGRLVGKLQRHLRSVHNVLPDYKRKTQKNAKITAQKKLKTAVRTVNLLKAVVGQNQIVEDPKSGEKLIKLDQRGRVLKKPIPVTIK